MPVILFIIILIVIVNTPSYIRKHLTQEIAAESCNYRDNHQLSEWNPLSKIEWLRLYPLKKVLFGIFWLVCLYISVRGIFLTVNNPRKTFIFLTVIFCAITLFTARKVWRYIRLPYHCIPVLNHIQTKEEIKEALQGECFEEVPFQHHWLQKYFKVLLSQNWAIIDGYLISRKAVKKIYFLHEDPVVNYIQIKFVYFNGEEFCLPSEKFYTDEKRENEVSAFLHKISQEVIEKADEENLSRKKDKSVVYWNMNYKGKFRRTLWFIPVVIILCFLTPYFMGRFWFVYDIILVAVLIGQLWYTYNMKKVEEKIETGDYMICPNCKKPIYKDENSCPHCHFDVHSSFLR
ncbi:MAG: hypothetical protein SO415_14510 [Oliverpabstia sp.]|nr:hypothetical protein [Oliverpabstia sp.]